MPKPELLETFPNPYGDRTYEIYMETTEFTSLCPLGGIETDAAELRLLDGRLIECRFAPLSGGATMTAFRLRDAKAGPQAVTEADTLRKRA